ncbi:MAG: hypothetical protein IPJ31_03085 [Bacteroidetes bacterium]|nr:hypothetical protein [Bacteroidota bacterium]
MAMCDAAFQFFSILKEDSFAIQIGRYGVVCTQIFPLLASKLNLPLSVVSLSYSLSFIIFYFSVFLLVLVLFKNEKMALVILLFSTLMVRHSFYWVQCEFVQGAVFTLFYLALMEWILQKEKVPFWFFLVSPFFLITIVYFYPLLLFIMLFGILFMMLLYKQKIRFLSLILVSYLVLFVVKLQFFNNFYDSKSMEGLENIFTHFPNYFQLKSFQNFYTYLVHDYYLLVLLAILTLIFLLYVKKILHAVLMCFFLVGVWFVITINYANGIPQFYIESQYLILVIFVGMPFSYFVMEHGILRPYTVLVVSAALILSLLRINATGAIYKQRVQYIRELSHTSQRKRIIPYEKLDNKKLLFTWGISFEVWLISTLETGSTHSIIYEESNQQFESQLQNPSVFITLMGMYPYKELNSRYFTKDSSVVYSRY